MSYLYKGMAGLGGRAGGGGGEVSGSVLLTWHEKVSCNLESWLSKLDEQRGQSLDPGSFKLISLVDRSRRCGVYRASYDGPSDAMRK